MPVLDSETLTQVFKRSEQTPQIVLAFDPHCPTNMRALKLMDEIGGWDIYVADVAKNHALGVQI